MCFGYFFLYFISEIHKFNNNLMKIYYVKIKKNILNIIFNNFNNE